MDATTAFEEYLKSVADGNLLNLPQPIGKDDALLGAAIKCLAEVKSTVDSRRAATDAEFQAAMDNAGGDNT